MDGYGYLPYWLLVGTDEVGRERIDRSILIGLVSSEDASIKSLDIH